MKYAAIIIAGVILTAVGFLVENIGISILGGAIVGHGIAAWQLGFYKWIL